MSSTAGKPLTVRTASRKMVLGTLTRPAKSLFDQLAILVKLPAATIYIITKGVFLIINSLTSKYAFSDFINL